MATDIQQKVERSIFELIRLKLVELEYLPDITLFAVTEAGYNSYQTAIQAVVTAKGFCIEIFGASSPQAKGFKKIPRIVIKTKNYLAGELGNQPNLSYTPVGDVNDPTSFEGKKLAPTTSNLKLEIHLVSKSSKQDRVLHNVIQETLTTRRYVPIYNDNTKNFFLIYSGYLDLEDLDEGVIERVYNYEAKDIYASEEVVVTTVAPINEITTVRNPGQPDTETNVTN
jgi:hypothetical protein